MKSDYSGHWKDPRWQKFRLKVLEKDGFTCTQCGETKRTLHAHHLYYIAKRKPWEYPIECVVTLCDECHKDEHAIAEEFKDWEIIMMVVARSKFAIGLGTDIGENARAYGASSVEEMADFVSLSLRRDRHYWIEFIGAYKDAGKSKNSKSKGVSK